MIRISVSRADATVLETETLTAGRIGLVCEFVFSSDWDDLEKVAVFDGEVTKEVALDENNRAIVPAECMATAGYKLRCGVTGLNAEQVVVLPTVYVNAGKIRESAEIADSSIEEITPSLASQVISRANEALRVANELASDAEGGRFDGEDGVSPTLNVTSITNGHRVSITDRDGTDEFDVMNGVNGEDGVSPTIAVSDITGGHVLTITDANGTRTVIILDGATGATGATGVAGSDGYSPTVAITNITGGHRVTITDANGTHSFDVMDGEDGEGSSITVDSALSDSSTNPVQNKVVKKALDGKGTYTKPSGGIPKSDLAAAVQDSLGKADTALQSVPSTYRTAAAQDTIDAGKADKITEVTISTAGAVTQALDAGKIYHFTGTLTALTITLNATDDLAQYHFDFNCGSTAPTVTIPSAVTMPDSQSFEANKHYEVDILNNYGAVISWAIS